MLYAPLGLVAKLPSLLPELVQAGKSQVALARLAGRAASMRVGGGPGPRPTPPAGSPGPSSPSGPMAAAAPVIAAIPAIAAPPPAGTERAAPKRSAAKRSAAKRSAAKRPAAKRPRSRRSGRFPIEGYDTLPASSVVALLGGLSADEQALVRAHETDGRRRRTILARLDQLERG